MKKLKKHHGTQGEQNMPNSSTEKDVNINLKAKDEASKEIHQVESALESLQKRADSFYNLMTNLTGLLGLNIISQFGSLATEVVEVDNRLKLLNDTVLQTGMNFRSLIDASNRSRTSLREFAEQFNRIGMSSGEYFKDDPGNLLKVVETLNKQFQLMHLTPTQLGSVNTELLNAIESGRFNQTEINSLRMHDNPLIKGFLEHTDENMSIQSFFDYVLSTSEKIDSEFQNMTMSLSQIGTVVQNEVIDIFKDFFDTATNIANTMWRWYENMKTNQPVLYGLVRSLIQVVPIMTTIVGLLRTSLFLITAIKSVAGGWIGMLAGIVGAGAFVGLSAYNIHNAKNNDLSMPSIAGTNTSELHLKNIEAEVKSINSKVGLERDTLSDLVSRTENIALQMNLNSGSSTGYNIDIAEQWAEQIRRDLKTNGIRGTRT